MSIWVENWFAEQAPLFIELGYAILLVNCPCSNILMYLRIPVSVHRGDNQRVMSLSPICGAAPHVEENETGIR